MQRVQGNQWWLAGSVLTVALAANIPAGFQTQLGISRGVLVATLAAILVILLTRHLRALLILATIALITGANLPDSVARSFNINTEVLLGALAGLVLVAVLNRVLEALPRGVASRRKTLHGLRALVRAVEAGRVPLVTTLVKSGVDLNAPGPGGKRVLSRAVETGNIDVVKILARNGADVNFPDREGRRPLERARQLGHVDVARCLRIHGAQ